MPVCARKWNPARARVPEDPDARNATTKVAPVPHPAPRPLHQIACTEALQTMLSHRSLIATLFALPAAAAAGAEGPCDILGAAGNPCVAAHSTTRALYSKYSGPLYKVSRKDGRSADVGVVEAGGFANISAQEGFCAVGDCLITKVYDQSPKGNHLGQRISCVPGQGCVYHKMVNASKHKIAVRGGRQQVYGMWLDPGFGYNVDVTTGVAKGNEPESIYAVMSGTHYNGNCCFDYGNSENNQLVPWRGGAGSMEAIYFGKCSSGRSPSASAAIHITP